MPSKKPIYSYSRHKPISAFKKDNRSKNPRILKQKSTHIDKYFLTNLNIKKLKIEIETNPNLRKKLIDFLKKDEFGIKEARKLDLKTKKELENILNIRLK
jgi:hypothetical protein